MSSLRPKTPAELIADRIDASQQELANHIAVQLRSLYEAVDTVGLQQEILDAFGVNATAALTKYEAMRQALAIIAPDVVVPIPDLSTFQPQPDGKVIYVATPTTQNTELEIDPE